MPTESQINTTQTFKPQPVKIEPRPEPKASAKKLTPNPYTGLPVKNKGKVITTPEYSGVQG